MRERSCKQGERVKYKDGEEGQNSWSRVWRSWGQMSPEAQWRDLPGTGGGQCRDSARVGGYL